MDLYTDIFHKIGYNTDASHLQQFNNVEIFLPQTKDEITKIVEHAIKEDKHIVCRGGGTNLVWNCLPREKAIIIDLSKLNHVIEIWGDYVDVEAWITNDCLNEKLGEIGKFFPVVLWSHSAAEIGWMIATNGAWMRAIKYWKMQDWVVELEVLYVDKEKKIKVERIIWNNCKEFLGAEWNFWIVLQARIKIIDLPGKSSMEFKSFVSIQEALDYVHSLKNEYNNIISALEIINPQVAEFLGYEKKYYVLAEFEDSSVGSINDEIEMGKIWERRDACYAVVINAGYDQIEDPEIHNNEKEFFEWFEEKQIPIFWHIGIWVLHPHFKSEQIEEVKDMYVMVQKFWWKISWEHWIGKKKQEYLSNDQINSIHALKEKWDFNNIFWF